MEEAKNKLQEALTHAERQVAVSEARTASLQSAVEKSEERAASLDLQLKAKSPLASGKPFIVLAQLGNPYWALDKFFLTAAPCGFINTQNMRQPLQPLFVLLQNW